MASHRKPRPRTIVRAGSPTVGITTAALASVTLLTTQSANAAPREPKPSVQEVQKRVDDLYHQAGSATEDYNQAKEATDARRKSLDGLLDDIARRTDRMNTARRTLGMYATAQYRQGAVAPTAALMFSDSPQSYFDETQLMGRLSDRQHSALADLQSEQAGAAKKRVEASQQLQSLSASQAVLARMRPPVAKVRSRRVSFLMTTPAAISGCSQALQRSQNTSTCSCVGLAKSTWRPPSARSTPTSAARVVLPTLLPAAITTLFAGAALIRAWAG